MCLGSGWISTKNQDLKKSKSFQSSDDENYTLLEHSKRKNLDQGNENLIPINDVFIEENEKYFIVNQDLIPLARFSDFVKVYIRDSYKVYGMIRSALIEKNFYRSISVSGNPGIGKSFFYIYCAKLLIQRDFLNDHTLVLHSDSECMEYIAAKKSFQRCSEFR